MMILLFLFMVDMARSTTGQSFRMTSNFGLVLEGTSKNPRDWGGLIKL
jgi:hypothetical protein